MEFPAYLGWTLWASTSPYSPLNLHHLPQPVPSDCPAHAEPGVFTFEDAFEDLLAVASGRPLPDIGARYEMRRMLHHMFPTGEDTTFYIHRLHSQQLLENSNFMTFRPRPMWDPDTWDSIHREFGRLSKQEEREQPWGELGGKDEERDRRRRGLFDELDRIFHVLEKRLSRPESQARESRESKPRETEKEEKKYGDEPDTYDEWYSSVQSAVSQGAASLSTLVKIARDSWVEAQNTDKSRESGSSSSAQSPGKLETVESTEEHTDEYGNHHVKRTVRTLNEKGEEVRKEVHVHVRSPRAPPRFACRQGGTEEDNTRKDGGKEDKKASDGDRSGWFWRR